MTPALNQRGVSLLEALVAMAVMAIGAVAVVGMQATLRLNGDVAKQRAEAVRQAQQQLEVWRGFTRLDATGGEIDWTDITNLTDTLTPPNSNATYTRDFKVVPNDPTTDNPRSRSVHAKVTWVDRASVEQSVTLNTVITGAHPELGGSLSIPLSNSLLANPGGRHPAIPPAAVPQTDGTSLFNPPGAPSTLGWYFNNTTGVITRVCTNVADTSTCTDLTALLLSGFVRFSTGFSQPTPAQAEAPTSATLPITVAVEQEQPFSTTVSCFTSLPDSTAMAYFCVLQVNPPSTPNWTGTTVFGGIPLAGSINDDDDDEFRVCRYSTVRSNSAVVPTDLKNEQHPLRYVAVNASLTNQNYLVIRAGDDDNPFTCPNDDTATPNVNGATWHQQPSS